MLLTALTETLPLSRTRRVAQPQPGAADPRPSRWLHSALVVLILGAFTGRVIWIASTDSITSDEATHLVHCLHYWMTGDDLEMWKLGSPRLPHTLHAFGSYVALRVAGSLPSAEGEALRVALNDLVLSGSARVLLPARVLAALWGLGLILILYVVAARRHGPWLGALAAALLSLVPEVTAHTAIAGSDIPFTTAAFLSIVLLGRYVEKPSLKRWVGMALAVGLAWAMRHTALVLLALAGATHLVVQVRELRPRQLGEWIECGIRSVWATAGLSALAFLVLWAGDGFGIVTVGEVGQRVLMVRIPQQLGALGLSGIPVPSSLLSILKQIRHQNQGHEAFFCGAFSNTGWTLYFPVAFLLKTPIGLLALVVLAAARVRTRAAFDAVLLAFLVILWLMLVRNKVNIGLRYALLTYPIALLFVVRLFEGALWRDRIGRPLTVLATAAFVAASVGCGNRCLSYFNEIGGGPAQGWVYLADSNVDWGQDFDRLVATVRRLGIRELTTDLSSERRLVLPGVDTIVNPARSLQVPTDVPSNRRLYDSDGGYLSVYTRHVAVSVNKLYGLYSQNDMSWLRTRRLVARVGDSTFLFDMDRPAERALAP